MFAFLFLLFPCAIVAYCFKFGNRSSVLVAIVGAVTSIIFCAIEFMFVFMHRVVPFDFWRNCLYVYLTQVFFPLAAVFAIFCLASKDSCEFKAKMFFPLTASFYAIYVPFYILSYNMSALSAFELFGKPVMFLSYIAFMSVCVQVVVSSVKSKSNVKAALWIFVAILFSAVPAAVEAAWLIGVFFVWWLLGLVFYVAVTVLVILLWQKFSNPV